MVVQSKVSLLFFFLFDCLSLLISDSSFKDSPNIGICHVLVYSPCLSEKAWNFTDPHVANWSEASNSGHKPHSAVDNVTHTGQTLGH